MRTIAAFTLTALLAVPSIAQEGANSIKRYPYISAQEGLGYASNVLVNTFAVNNDINISYSAKIKKLTSLTVVGFNHQYQKITGLFNEGRDMLNGISCAVFW